MIKFASDLVKNIEKDLEKEVKAQEEAVRQGLREAAIGFQRDWRRQAERAFNHVGLVKSIRVKHYKNSGFNPASLVFTKAPKIMRAFDVGVNVNPKSGKYLAIPTENAPKKSGTGKFAKGIQPNNWDASKHGELQFVPPRGGNPPMLVVKGYKASYSRKTGEFRGYRRSRAKSKKNNVTVVMFILVDQTKMPRRLTVGDLAEKWLDRVPSLIAKHRENAK